MRLRAQRRRRPPRLARPARHRPRRARLPAGALPPARLHALGRLLVRRPLQLRRLQRPLLPARGAARDPRARGGDRRASRRSRSRRSSGASGGRSARWSSRSFAVVWAGIVLSAAFPFALGVALALLALWALQAGHRWRFAVLTLLTLAASPVALVLLVVVLAGVGLARRGTLRSAWVPALASSPRSSRSSSCSCGSSPAAGRYPFPASEAAAALVFCVLGLACTWRVESARVLRFVFVGVRRRGRRASTSCRRGSARTSRGSATSPSRSRCSSLALRRWRPLPVALVVVGARALLERDAARGQLDARRGGRHRARGRLARAARLPPRATCARATASRPWTPPTTGRRSISPEAGSRSRAAGSARTTSRSTALLYRRALAGRLPALAAGARRRLRRPHRRRRPTTARGGRRDWCAAAAPGCSASSRRAQVSIYAVPHAAADRHRTGPAGACSPHTRVAAARPRLTGGDLPDRRPLVAATGTRRPAA